MMSYSSTSKEEELDVVCTGAPVEWITALDGEICEDMWQDDEPPDSTAPPSSGMVVKSTAVVKYEMVQMPVKFLELRPQTDLKQPPSNWLHGHSKWESYMQRASLSTDNPFSSFKMAHCFPELTGEIDAISDAENVKKLLKIPYSKAHVSMMVHRVGNTLLLDDFDIHKHLLRKQEADWQWLRRFYYETVVRNMAEDSRYKCVLKKNKSRDHLQDRNMFSKFLYYSLADESVEDEESVEEDTKGDIKVMEASVHSSPDPLPETEMGQLGHQRTVVWNFEDLHMLIGANLPIFGGGTHPCVSLRLRDMRKPINVLTGLDYWLDNLMCNVPELAMCYHLNGIVKNYELIKTEDIPNMPDSHFSPKVVKDVAQNILSFLKSNATKEGHTYWLFKGHGDDIVKLYDLTTLSADCMAEDGSENPFTVPVGILLYRVARNIRKTAGRKKSGTIRTLLKNCIALLDKTLHPQIVTSAHYLLSDLYISDDIHNTDQFHAGEGSEFKDEDEPDEREAGEELAVLEEKAASFLEVQTLCWPEPGKEGGGEKTRQRNELVRYPPVSGSQEERCREALRHIAEGLSCLHASLSEDTEDSKHKVETQAECNPSEAIPLHYEPLHPKAPQKAAKPALGRHTYSVNELSLLALSSMSHSTWHNLSKVLLLRKAAISYLGLSRINLASEKFGCALKYIKLSLCSFASMSHMCQAKADENQELISAIWGLCGDIHIMLVQQAASLEIHREDFLQRREEDRAIWESAQLELGSADFHWVGDLTSSTEDNLHRSVYSYRKALELAEGAGLPADRVNVLLKRYGNVENELGVYYMNKAGTMLSTTDNTTASNNTIQELWQKSFHCFEQGIEVFTRLKDHTNVALLHSNTGRLMRLCAQAVADSQTDADRQTDAGRREFSAQERHYLTQAQTHYKQALELLEKYHKNSKLTESVAWELSTSYFTMATLLQDFAPLSSFDQKTVEKEVTDLMMKALHHCSVDVVAPVQQLTVQYRAATIHHRLASLYHNAYRNQVPHTNDQKRRHLRSLAELHYGKAYQLFLLLDNPCELLRVQLERVAMAEHQFAHQTSVHGQLKPLHAALECLMPLAAPVKSIITHIEEAASGADFEGYVEEAGKLLGILASRLQFVLHNTIKSMMSAKKGKSFDPEVVSVFKKMYAASLHKYGTKDDGDVSLLARCQHLLAVLANIEMEYRKLPTTYHPG